MKYLASGLPVLVICCKGWQISNVRFVFGAIFREGDWI